MILEVQGHTDSQGTADSNQRLSQQRADAVRAYLVAHGINSSRLTSKGYGMTQPIAPNDSAANRAKNRRIEFVQP